MNWRYGVLWSPRLAWQRDSRPAPLTRRREVGEAAVIQNQVVRVMGSAASQINVGDGVLRDEVVRTGLESAARLVMAGNTNLSLGPGATLTRT